MTSSSHRVPGYVSAAGIGVVAGLRSQLPLALLALAANRGELATTADFPLRLLRLRTTLFVAIALAAGEFIGDKLPIIPSRLKPGPLLGRFACGAVAGAVVAREAGLSPGGGAIFGVAGAGLGALGGYAYRVAGAARTPVPDPMLGVIEDLAAVTIGWVALRRRG